MKLLFVVAFSTYGAIWNAFCLLHLHRVFTEGEEASIGMLIAWGIWWLVAILLLWPQARYDVGEKADDSVIVLDETEYREVGEKEGKASSD